MSRTKIRRLIGGNGYGLLIFRYTLPSANRQEGTNRDRLKERTIAADLVPVGNSRESANLLPFTLDISPSRVICFHQDNRTARRAQCLTPSSFSPPSAQTATTARTSAPTPASMKLFPLSSL